MTGWREWELVGLDGLDAWTTLLQRHRLAAATAGSFDAAEVQWWWRQPRATDERPQLFWFDELGPVASAVATAWTDDVGLTLTVPPHPSSPHLSSQQQTMVVDRALEHLHTHGINSVALEVDHADTGLQGLLADRGFVFDEPGLAEAWLETLDALDATDRPAASPPDLRCRLTSRAESTDRPHHMLQGGRNHPDTELRLRQTSLYRADLDLVVYAAPADEPDESETVAAYGLFWFDRTTAVGVVEPMRTEDDHQRRGLARHPLTTGIDRLAQLGAERIKICYELSNPAASALYLDVGFVPTRTTDMWSGPTGPHP